ncbi:MAG: hypothetical protein WA433_04500 [Desulfobaccales bacterium]
MPAGVAGQRLVQPGLPRKDPGVVAAAAGTPCPLAIIGRALLPA